MPSKVSTSPAKRDNTTPSCAVCNRRKVKCDRVFPCAPCRKTGLECAFPEPARKKARKKPPTPPPEVAPLGNGVAPTAFRAHNASSEVRRVFGGVGYEFVGNRNGADAISGSSPAKRQTRSVSGTHGSNLLFQPQPQTEPLPISLTQALTIGKAYEIYVDPVVKVLHCNCSWTCAGHGDDWDGETLDLTRTPDQCLMRAVLFMTAVATHGADLLGSHEYRGQALIERCRADAETALSESNFMKTREFRVLQALVLYMIALQSLDEDETVWSMLGMAIRIASSLGLPQDLGEDATQHGSLSPYQIEMSRRLWWAIIALDARITRILGRTGYLSHNFLDIPRPANADDSELFPAMLDIPGDDTELRQSVYIRYRATLSDVLPFIYASGDTKDKCTGLIEMIDSAERQIEDVFMRHCDKSVPIQLLTFIAGRGYIKRVKLAMYSIYPITDDPTIQTPYASEAFWLAKDSMELFITLWTDPSLKPWQWHWKHFFGWHTLRILAQEIAKRSSCAKVLDAWRLIKQTASLVTSALMLGEEKARLVGDLRMLIEAGDIPPARPPESYSYALGGVKSIRPGMGSNPHNALFPGMNSTISEENGLDSDPAEFDLKKINWMEIDRVLVQLGTHGSG